MPRRSSASTPFLAAGAMLVALAVLGAALLPIADCPRVYVVTRDPAFQELMRKLKRVTHELEPCTVCGGRGKVTPLRRWLWGAQPPP